MSNRYAKKKTLKDNLLPDGQKISFALYNPFLEDSSFNRASSLQTTKHATSSFSENIGSITDSSSKKRSQSKLSYGQKKKSKMKKSVANDEDQNLDSDLFALVKNIPTQNSDSDSSHDTIIITDGDTDASSTDTSENKPQSSSQFSGSTFTFPSLISTSNLKNSSISRVSVEKNKNETVSPASTFESKPSASEFLTALSQKSSFSSSSSSKTAVNKSIYAEMGLDEDLCDVKAPKLDYKGKSMNSQTIGHSVSPVNDTSSNIQIKREVDDPAYGMHVSMTFEADPYDMDDEMPLSFLKNKSVAEVSSSESRNSSNKKTSYTPIPIKQELVDENEIPYLNCGQLENISIPNVSEGINLSQKFLQLPVKIKTEPTLDNDSESLNLSKSEISSNAVMQVTNSTNVNKNNFLSSMLPSSIGDKDFIRNSNSDSQSNPMGAKATVHSNAFLNQPGRNSTNDISKKKTGKGKKKGKQSKASNLTASENDPTSETALTKSEEASPLTTCIFKTSRTVDCCR